jgi:hypothetical protein
MGIEYTFYDYIDADGSGANIIKDWLNGAGKPAKAHFTNMIGNLEASPPPGFIDSVWHKPFTEVMKGQWDGFIEIKKRGRIQYRLIAQIQGRNVFLVATGFHMGSYETDVTPGTAKERVAQMMNNPARYRREHDYR